jgi:fermentation-respiration switch protein FrsA (DUF1100 family)
MRRLGRGKFFCFGFSHYHKISNLPDRQISDLKKIKQVKCPILFIHGRKDSLIPFWHAERLFAAAMSRNFFVA